MKVTVRPVDIWPGKITEFRQHGPFKATYAQTLDGLRREVAALTPPGRVHANPAVIQLYVTESEIRLDGALRATARPVEPGVILSFASKHGPLRYHTDRYRHWHDNLRAIVLGLEALRKIDRYGITSAGEQYTGWQAIGPAVGLSTKEAAARLIARLAWPGEADAGIEAWFRRMIFEPEMLTTTYRRAAQRCHPDAGGDPAIFRQLTEARDLLVAS